MLDHGTFSVAIQMAPCMKVP